MKPLDREGTSPPVKITPQHSIGGKWIMSHFPPIHPLEKTFNESDPPCAG